MSPRNKQAIYESIVRQSRSLPGSEAERTVAYVTAHPLIFDEYSQAPEGPASKPAPSPAPLTLNEAVVDHAISRSSKTAQQVIDLKAKELVSKEGLSYQEAVGQILATEPGLATAYYGRG